MTDVRAIVLVALLATVACASPVESPRRAEILPADTVIVIVLPAPEGPVGAVTVVPHVGPPVVLDHAYVAARVTAEAVQTQAVTPSEVQAVFGPALAARPPRPVVFEVYFVLGTDSLTAESRAALDAALQDVARRPVPEITVTGYADPTGTDKQNDALSLRRAARIRQELLARGFASDRIDVVGRGSRGATGTDRDRRVELVVR